MIIEIKPDLLRFGDILELTILFFSKLGAKSTYSRNVDWSVATN
jgi:hypothetical protein